MNQSVVEIDEWNVEFEVLAAVVMKSYNAYSDSNPDPLVLQSVDGRYTDWWPPNNL
jgi:hypothetical protein